MVQEATLQSHQIVLHITSELPAEQFFTKLIAKIKAVDEESLLANATPAVSDRYDPFVPESLLKKAFVYDHLDIPGIREWAKRWEHGSR